MGSTSHKALAGMARAASLQPRGFLAVQLPIDEGKQRVPAEPSGLSLASLQPLNVLFRCVEKFWCW